MSEMPLEDPTERSRWGALQFLWRAMTVDVDRVYADAGLDPLEDRFVMELVRLHTRGPMTVRRLSESVLRDLDKVNRKVNDMAAAGLVTVSEAADEHERTVAVTAATVPFVDAMLAEWEATEASIAESESETPYPLKRAFADLAEALQRKSFHDRLQEKLAKDPRWSVAR
jgi:DNA-binding MarR family transcriptional regulator